MNDIHDIDNTDWLYKLRPVSFIQKGDVASTRQFGLIAEEVADIVPNVVYSKDGHPETVHYTELVAPMLKALQEQKQELDKVKKENEMLIRRIELLENKNK